MTRRGGARSGSEGGMWLVLYAIHGAMAGIWLLLLSALLGWPGFLGMLMLLPGNRPNRREHDERDRGETATAAPDRWHGRRGTALPWCRRPRVRCRHPDRLVTKTFLAGVGGRRSCKRVTALVVTAHGDPTRQPHRIIQSARPRQL